VIATSPYQAPAAPASVVPVPLPSLSLRGRRRAVRRRRLALGARDWLGVAVIACFAASLFAVTFFSLLGR
jgi:hypothetical protein